MKIIKFRTTNHRLPVETGRWQGKSLGERFCTLCNNCQIGDEFHYILECDTIQNIRKCFLCNYYCQRPNVIKFTELANVNSNRDNPEKIAFLLWKCMMLCVLHDILFFILVNISSLHILIASAQFVNIVYILLMYLI